MVFPYDNGFPACSAFEQAQCGLPPEMSSCVSCADACS